MAKKKTTKLTPERKAELIEKIKSRPQYKRKDVELDIALMVALDCASQVAMGRDKPRYQEIGDKYDVPLLSVKRIWTDIPADTRELLIKNADAVIKHCGEKMMADKMEVVNQLEDKMLRIAHRAADIMMDRLNKAPHDVADRDIISILTKTLSLAKEERLASREAEPQNVIKGNVYNIIDQSISTYEQGQ